jgi:thiamine-phosphate pyrophosphorylase
VPARARGSAVLDTIPMTLDQAPAAMANMAIAGLYAIADTAQLAPASLLDAVAQAIDGGATIVQYRDKCAQPNKGQAQHLVQLCQRRGVPLIINDDVELAYSIGAAGVHLGRDDAPLTQARQRLGLQAVIGISCYNQLERALSAAAAGADYVAFGSFYPSATKPAAQRASLELLREARQRVRIPIVAIGGITPENGAALVAAGADALAVIQGLFAQVDVRAAARRYAVLFAHTHDNGKRME